MHKGYFSGSVCLVVHLYVCMCVRLVSFIQDLYSMLKRMLGGILRVHVCMFVCTSGLCVSG